ncbi:aminoglycoside phosphotransferase family protein [Catellatospora sp. KI3]|uniref:aminoglycoside phosphotransferase family protein n=1 Tax=Catellatospora sp. KI3 TaxID=3041620 RepID=UPI0024825531|nr:aminoglycoside phosphotransferase family protein [Catellatospora sp. KI3]MDI1461175.1 aminoglycoside phosphotransferase family protein [Catellatospora sp. KI3]
MDRAASFDLLPPDLPVVTQLSRIADARGWLAELPELIAQVRERFQLTLSPPLRGGSCSWVAPATLPDGTGVIVKIAWPHPEMYGEPAALRLWQGDGAVRLLAHDPRHHALLLERCDPGLPLGDSTAPADERLRQGARVLRRLWRAAPTGGFDPLDRVTAHWADLVDERMARLRPGYDPDLVAYGARLLRELPATADRRVLLHGDFNPNNVLSCGDGRWLAIDPKPMAGDPAYDPWPLLEQVDDPFAHPDPAAVLAARRDLLAAELSVDPQRIVRWAVARRVETALWLAHHGDTPGGAAVMGEARTLAEL